MFTSRTRASLAACATFALLGVVAILPAQAQTLTLNSGDNVTVNGTGTVGTIGGAPIANTTTSYDDTASRGYYAVKTNGTAAFTASGGTFTDTYTISGGGYGLFAQGSGPITISGGTFTGVFAALSTNRVSSITITGGTFTGGANGYAFYNAGTIDLYGMFNGYTPGTVTPLNSYGTLTGTLQNNTASQTFSYNNFGTINLHDVAPAAAPEPSSVAALGIGLLGLVGLALRARKRQTA